jgi:quinoprotein glucose dehydrogenase
VIYVLGRGSSLIALDATTGKELWIHEGLAGIHEPRRELLAERGPQGPTLLFSINSFLQEIDARTGKTILTFGENGIVDLRHGLARV